MLKALWRAFVDGIIDSDEKVASSKIPNSRQEWKIHTLFENKMTQIDTPFPIKTAKTR